MVYYNTGYKGYRYSKRLNRYKGNRNGQNSRYRKKNGNRKYPMYRGLASKVKAIVDSEIKNNVRAVDFTAFSVGTPFLDNQTSIAQGLLTSQRLGNWLDPVNIHGYLQIRGQIQPAAVENTIDVRLGVLQWHNDDSVDPPLLASIMFDGGSPMGPFSFKNKDSFTILWTRCYTIVNDRNNPNFSYNVNFYRRLKMAQKILYDGAAVNKQNQIYFFAFSGSLAAADDPEVSIDITFRYTDS